MITGLINSYSGVVTREDEARADTLATWTAGEANRRVAVGVFPQESPDPLRYGATPCRPARIQVVTYEYDQQQWSSDIFEAGQIVFGSPNADRPRGDQRAWQERVNLRSPQYQAYGSLFEASAPTYGMG